MPALLQLWGVLAPTEGQVEVLEPLRCPVGCSACVSICKPGAVSFPPRQILEAFAE